MTNAPSSRHPEGRDTTSSTALTKVLEDPWWDLRQEVLEAMATSPLQPHRDEDLDRYRSAVLEAVKALADRGWGRLGYPSEFGGSGDIRQAVKVFETVALGDLSVLVKFGVQFGLFGGSVWQLGTEEHHREFLARIGRLEVPGCFAMTERAHGSNVRELETVATYHPEDEEFEIHTPSEAAEKDWIGNAALHGQVATVFARLRTGGVDYGVHAFLVPIRTPGGTVMDGVEIGDRGRKVGLNGVDNGTLRFHHVRVPRTALLNRFGTVEPDGSYHSPIEGDGRRFFTMLGTLVMGRVSIAAASVSTAKRALTIAVRYGERRRQFGPPDEEERPLLDFLAHRRLLLPRLAATYGLHFAVWDVVDRLHAHDDSPSPELEVRAAALKAYASRHAMDTIQACREACGGEGYDAANGLGALREDVDVFTTFEGTNPVLLQLVAKGLLTEYRETMGDLRFWEIVQHLARRTRKRIQKANPVAARRTERSHIRDPDFHRWAFRTREQHLLHTLAQRLQERIGGGMEPFDAVNECQDHLVTLGTAHGERLVLEAFQAGVAGARDAGTSETLRELCTLHALCRMERHAGWYLESGFMEGAKTKAIRSAVNEMLTDVRESAQMLVDAFAIPDPVLRSPAGRCCPTGGY